MNHAYADGSHQDDRGGWGVVLLVPGAPPAHHSGEEPVSDNGACELLAALHAVQLAPERQPLTLHTDATCVVQAIRRGTLHPHQDEMGAAVRAAARERSITLSVTRESRDARRMREAHQLATNARLGVPDALPGQAEVRVKVSRLAWGSEATLTFNRNGASRRIVVPLGAQEGVAPALLALRAMVAHAEENEHLQVRLDSTLAPTLWSEPEYAAHPAARALLAETRAAAVARRVTLDFV